MSGIVWLASYPKSGNTWMRIFLAHLIPNAGEPLALSEIGREAAGDREAHLWEAVGGKDYKTLKPEEAVKLLPEVHEAIARKGHFPVLCKTHSVLGDFLGTPLISPALTWGGIYIVRNPLDVVLSLANHLGTDSDYAIGAMANDRFFLQQDGGGLPEFLSSWSNHVKSWTVKPSPGLLVIRYEDLLEKPLESFGKVARLLQLNRTEKELKRAIEFASFERLRKAEEEEGFAERSKASTEEFFRQGTSGAWRDKLKPAQVDRIVNDHKQQMARFGYLHLTVVRESNAASAFDQDAPKETGEP